MLPRDARALTSKYNEPLRFLSIEAPLCVLLAVILVSTPRVSCYSE